MFGGFFLQGQTSSKHQIPHCLDGICHRDVERSYDDIPLEEDTGVFVNYVIESLQASDKCLEELRMHQQEDEVCQ